VGTDSAQERRQAFIRKYQMRFGVIACVLWPTLYTFLQPEPTPQQTLVSFGFRFIVVVIAYIPLSYFFLGRAWDKHYGSSEE